MTWDAVFSEGFRRKSSLEDELGAIALVGKQKSAAPTVVRACHYLIRRGDVSQIPELEELLWRYGDKYLAEDYMNCGQPELYSIGLSWAWANGYSGGGTGKASHRAAWRK